MRLHQLEKEIVSGMARAFYVCAWADRQEERGVRYPGQELMDVAPPTPRYFRDFALMFAGGIFDGHLCILLDTAAWADVLRDHPEALGNRALDTDGIMQGEVEALKTDEYARSLGHCLAMQGLGHGVSWFDDHAKFQVSIPHREVYLD